MKIERNIPFLNYDGRDAGREFREWLKGNSSVFKSYNYEGSGITTITDILGQYLMQTAYMSNMVYNESNILRSKIWTNKASIASAKGYTPHKKLGAKVNCDILIKAIETKYINKRNYIFIGHKNNETYPFVLINDVVSTKQSNDIQSFENVELVQGLWENYSYHVKDPGFNRFTINDSDIDISTLNVYVYIDQTSKVGVKYNRIQHISDINNAGYILILDSDNKYSLVFGDDKIANKPPVGSNIFIEYVKTNGEKCNDINEITLTTPIENSQVISIKAKNNSYGGSDEESMQSIEMNGIVNSTLTDSKTYYTTLLKTNFPTLTDINVVDGEKLDPPRYGIIYIYTAIGQTPINKSLKEKMYNILNKYKITPCIFAIKDPRTIEIDIYLDINFNSTQYYESETDIKNLIIKSVKKFADKHYGKITSEWYPTELIHYIKSEVNVKIQDSMYRYKIHLPIENPGINAEYNVNIPKNISVSKIEFQNEVLNVSSYQIMGNNIEYHPISNTISFISINREETDYVLITSDDDASFIEKETYWIPIIKNINVSFNNNKFINTNDIC
jgi:hypothetical protein